MRKLWISFIVLAALGSIYPFNFQVSGLSSESVGAFVKSCCTILGRGDILGNIILFIPIGFTGILSAGSEKPANSWFLRVCVIGAIVAFALQVLQLFLPSRDANLQDVVWNLSGIMVGAVFARLAGAGISQRRLGMEDTSLVPLTLVATWLCYRLIPFIPSIDLQLFKNSLKPLLSFRVDPISLIHDATAWLCIGYLLRHVRRDGHLDNYLPVLMLAVFGLEVIIVDNSVDLTNIVGATIAALVWFGVLRHIHRQERVLVVLLVVALILTGLSPFDTRPYVVSFNWLPFQGFLGGSMYINAQSAAEKVFLYGSLVYLLWRTKLNVPASILVSVVLVTMIELGQMRFVGHTPEITDPLLVVFAAFALSTLEKQGKPGAPVGQQSRVFRFGRSTVSVDPGATGMLNGEAWVTQSVNLRGHQFDFLSRLSQESGMSVSRVARRIIAQFIEALEADTSRQLSRASIVPDSSRGRDQWVRQSVNLRGSQYDFLERLSSEMNVSISRVIRRIVSHFMDSLAVTDTVDDSNQA